MVERMKILSKCLRCNADILPREYVYKISPKRYLCSDCYNHLFVKKDQDVYNVGGNDNVGTD